MKTKLREYEKQIGPVVVVLAIVGLSTVGYFYYQIAEDVVANTTELEETIIGLQEEKIVLAEKLEEEKNKNQAFESQIGEIASTVGTLEKLSKTDKELLQKYSKVYFLNEHYVPDDLISIPPDYLYEKSREIEIHAKAYPYLQEMIEDAEGDGINLRIISAYRSFGEQGALKGSYQVTYGTGANRFSADQGYSEHQLGTAVDFTTEELGTDFTSINETNAYDWLLKNAYKYGFTLSYPAGNEYYQFEPWHWRFVGKALARYLHFENLNFYDVPQSKIDAYLINIFD